MRYLVDSDWLIDAASGKTIAVQTLRRLSHEGLAVSPICVAEIYEGAFGASDLEPGLPEAKLAAFRDFLGGYAVLPVTDAVAERFARVRASLRGQGQLIPDLDLLIAATALTEGLTLITRNVRHFGRISDLALYAPE